MDPGKLYDPAGQGRHCAMLVPPLMNRNVPAGHDVHAVEIVCFVRPEYLPGAQAVQLDMEVAPRYPL